MVDVVNQAAMRSSRRVGSPAANEEVLAAAEHVERLEAMDSAPYRLARDRERRPLLLKTDVRVVFIAEAHEIAVVDPLSLQELHRLHRFGADEGEVDAVGDFVVVLGGRVGVVGRTVGRAASDDAVHVDVREHGHLRVVWVHAPHV